MHDRIRQILTEITRLEDELAIALQEQQVRLRYRFDGSKIRFDENLRKIHHELKTSIFTWLRKSEVRNVVSAPFIYMMIVPFAFLDLFVSVYQGICFPLYRIAKVARSEYIVVDRHQLPYLNLAEKLNCVYCGYVGGLISYTAEIASRTELYWCPIKHARKVMNPHRRYAAFADFGDAEGYRMRLDELRAGLAEDDAGPDEEGPPR
ncbi:MAG: hypothetical protein OEW35_02640 [Gammaproteobacteria bacterium]|nr:hypothetical protein [Gammaproteobacteria bacterium]MDH4254598.1 hypothetical protein [Gammaproteobacteria bacterium]MDH5309443.1 hypothetical protein [Gammaproteobacteria bacterium]